MYREASLTDIEGMKVVRSSVLENRLSSPALVTDADYHEYLSRNGKGWVCLEGERIVGFSIVDLQGSNVWALFVYPGYEGKGIGRRLHDLMMDWYFSQTGKPIWLSTEPGSRAESFYRAAGWEHTGPHGTRELKFEMRQSLWSGPEKRRKLYA